MNSRAAVGELAPSAALMRSLSPATTIAAATAMAV